MHAHIHSITGGFIATLLAIALGTATQAAPITKAAAGTDLTAGASWTGGNAPTSGDIANWTSTSLGAGLTLAGATSWGGISVAGATGAIGVTGAGTLTLGAGGIDMSLTAVDLTWGTPVTLGAGQTWIVNSGRSLTASGIVSGPSIGLTKAGLGTLTLTGANTYDGTTTIFGGTLVADTATNATILSSSSPLAFTGSGTFQLKGLASQARSQILNGLVLTSGAATIDANNTGTSTTIDLRGAGGTLTITRSAGATVDFKATTGTFGTSAIVKTAQTNDATGILGAWATVNTGADWAIHNGSGVVAAYTGYSTLGGNTLSSSATANYRVASNPTTPTGNITMAATGTIDINTLRINDAAARTIDVRNDTTQGILRFGAIGGLLTSGGNHIVGVAGAGNPGTITAGAADNTAGELVVNNASALTVNSVIADNGTGAVTLTKSGAGTLTFNAVNNSYTGGTVVNSGSLSTSASGNATDTPFGTGPMTVNPGATLALNRTYVANNLTLNNATVTSGNSFSSTLPAAYTITLNGISTVNVTGNLTIAGNLTGTGGLIKTGGSTVPVTGTITYTGPTVINAGALTFKKSLYGNDTAQWTPANITVAGGGALILNVGGAGEFTITQFGTLFNNLTTGVNNNGLKAGAVIGLDTNTAGGTHTLSATLADSTGTGGGAVGLKHFGAGTLELTGANSYSGPTITDRNGTLKVSSLNSVTTNPTLGTVHSASSSLGRPTTVANGTIGLGTNTTFAGGNLTYTGTGETTDRVLNLGGANGTTYTLDQAGGGLLKFTSAFTITDNRGPKTIVLQGSTAGTAEIAGTIPLGQSTANPNHLTKSGTGAWTLSAANANAGGVFTVNGGALVLAHATAIPGGIGNTGGLSALTFNGGVAGLGAGDFTRSLAAAGTVTGVTFTGNGGWAAYGADRAVNLGGNATPDTIVWATANTGFNGKTLILGNATATHMVTLQNPLDLGTAARTVQVDDGAAAIDGKLSGNLTGSTGGNLTKTGPGTLTLTGTNNYLGTTTVSAGTLLVNGTNGGAGLITAATGATLGGTGSIAGAATFSGGAKAVFTVTRDPVTQANTTPLTVTGMMAFNSTEIHLNLPANLPSGTYTLATSSATPTGTVTATPVVDSGSYAAGFTSAVVSLDTANKKLLLTVNGLPTNPTKLAITSVNGGASPVATAAFSVVVQAQDANGDARPVLADTAVSLGLDTGNGPLSGTLTGTIPAGSTSVTISGVIYGTAEGGVVLTATRTSGDNLTAANSSPFTVLPGTTPTYFTVTGFPSPQTAGSPGSVTVTVKTAAGTTAADYTGTVQFTSSAASAGLPANYTFVSGDNGVHVFGGITLNTAGTQSITATDTVNPSLTGTQAGITVTPAAAAALVVAGFPSPRTTGAAGTVTVTAKDPYGNTAPAYTGTIHFTSTDGAASLPADYTFTGGDAGVHTFTNGVTLNTVGVQSITATDTAAPSITGTQSSITVWVVPTNFTWRNAANGNWSDATKWAQSSGLDYAPLAAGQADYILNFIAGTYTATHNLNNGFLTNQLNFAGAVTVGGTSSVALAGTLPQINQNSSSAVTISTPLSLAANTTFGGSGNGAVTLSALISGSGSLTKNGSGTLTINNAANTFSGGTIINSGQLTMNVQADAALGTGPVTLNSPATLYLERINATNAMTLNGGTIIAANGFGDSWNGPVTLNSTTNIDTPYKMSFGGAISGGGGFVKTGGSQLVFSGANRFTGALTVQAGTLSVASFNRVSGGTATSNLGAPTDATSGTISLGSASNSATLDYSGPGETTDRVIKLAGTTGAVVLSQSGPPAGLPTNRGTSGLLKFTSDLSIPGTAGVDNRKTITLTHVASSATGANPGSGELSGSIGDSATGTTGQRTTSITKTGPGTWTLSGPNTYTGITRVQAGTLAITRPDALGAGALDITTGAKLQLDFIGTRQISVLTIDASGALPNGTYGSSSSLATIKDDVHFSGPGTVTVGPVGSPTTITLARTAGTEPSNGGVVLTFTATVAGAAPTGSVRFYDGLTLIGTDTLNDSYQASLTTTVLGGGTHAIVAQYVGNAGNAPSASAPLTQTVVETRSATTTTLITSGNPSNHGAAVTFTAAVSGGTTGNVTFHNGNAVLGTASLNGASQAALTTTSLAVGWNAITARYQGDAVHAPSSSTPPLFQVVNPPAGNGKTKVFILAGQSNMQGKSQVEIGRDPNNYSNTSFAGGLGSLRNFLNKNGGKYGYLADAANPVNGNPGWLRRSDVSVTYWGSGTAQGDVPSPSSPARTGDLDPFFGNNGEGPTNGNGRMGPEYAFGLVVGSQLADQVLLIKYAFGGKSLAVDFRPPGAVAARGGAVGPYYTGLLSRVSQVLSGLPANSYEISGFAWHQGWNDRVNATHTAEYEANMVNLIQDLRTAWNVPNMPVSIGNTGMANAPSGPGSLIEAQANVGDPAKHPEFAGTVTTVDTRPFDFGNLLGGTEEGYHWNWNADSYFNIGENMGKAMMAMFPATLSSARDILTFDFPGLPPTTFSGTNISVTVPYGTDVSALAPVHTVSPLATCAPASGAVRDFTTPQTYTVTAQDGSTQAYAVTVTPGPSPFSAWAADPAQGLTAGVNDGPNDDPDYDGIVNLMEFTLGGAPMVPGQAILPKLTKSPAGAWTFEYERSDLSLPPATTQVVEYGSNLTDWTALTIPQTTAGIVTITPGSPSDHVKVTFPDPGTMLFVRLKVTQ